MDLARTWDVIVVGGGHAGTEAALAAARLGAHTLLLTHSVETIGQMSCNPAIGGIGKGHLVREIDALGGAMGRAADRAGIHWRTLNASKGPAVRATRCQADRALYRAAIRALAESQPQLCVFQQAVDDLLLESGRAVGVLTQTGLAIRARSVVLTAGTFLAGQIHVGRTLQTAGRITLNSSSAFTGGVGLAGQVILNSNNLSGAFSGQVRIPQGGGTPDTVISQAAYPATVASLGGGSVGVVSYIRHDADCSPVSNGVRLLPVFFAPSPIRVAFYGPVLDSSLGGAAPVKIEWDMNGMWLPVDQFFSVSLSGRQVVIAPASGTTQTSIPAGRFRVTPRNAELICGGLTVTPPPISFEYFFRLFPDCNGNSIADPDDFISGFSQDCNHNGVPDSCDISSGASVDANSDGIPDECSGVNCPADFNGDRVLDPDDLADYIGCYFGTPQCSGADFNGDGVVDPDDLADFITAFFAGC